MIKPLETQKAIYKNKSSKKHPGSHDFTDDNMYYTYFPNICSFSTKLQGIIWIIIHSVIISKYFILLRVTKDPGEVVFDEHTDNTIYLFLIITKC